jgi:hypothetical protein
MRTSPLHSLGFSCSLVLVLTGCPSDDGGGNEEVETSESTTATTTDDSTSTATETTDSTDTGTGDTVDTNEDSTTGGGPVCDETHAPIDGGLADGEACLANSECMSGVCALFQDAPPLEGACEAAEVETCATRFTGRLLDFSTGDVVEGIDLKVAAALQAALMPGTATALAMGTSGADGTFDFMSDGQVSAPLGLVGLASADGYFLTATGLASPASGNFYGPANAIHDVWAVPAATLTDYSALLEPDPEFANALPLGEAGGVVGLVRDAATGEPIADATVVSTDPDTTGAVIRYLNEAGDGFDDTSTSSNGIFVLVKPGLGEVFGLEVGGVPVDGETGTAGSANGAIFTLIFNVP